MIVAVSRFLYALQRRSVRLQLADGTPEKTHLNHGLITLGAGLLGALIGWPLGLAWLGAQIGCWVACACYTYREVRQWWNAPKPAGWWWDAGLDVIYPYFFSSPITLGPIAFAVWAGLVALFHLALRPVE